MTLPPHPGLAEGPVYLDYNATTPVDPRVAEAMAPHLTHFFGNPSSSHPYGSELRSALAAARAQVAALIGGRPEELVYTGSGSEADLLALRGAVLAAGRPHPHVITQATEHPAVLETCRALQRLHGARITILPVDRVGLVKPADLAEALTDDTVLVSVMAANNETGALQPVAELADLAHARGALFHCDAAQAAGKVPSTSRPWAWTSSPSSAAAVAGPVDHAGRDRDGGHTARRRNTVNRPSGTSPGRRPFTPPVPP
ncbi:cysteine desulfurase family protein [Streptomyces sp. NPDC097617]|uniref:cysteine desulfurase family protein n=1 Tax=Streptomyces sp. NPDC097617 TaxID=3366091 RepID=UPI0037FA6C86